MASDLIGFEWENNIKLASAVNLWCDLPRLTSEIFPQLSCFFLAFRRSFVLWMRILWYIYIIFRIWCRHPDLYFGLTPVSPFEFLTPHPKKKGRLLGSSHPLRAIFVRPGGFQGLIWVYHLEKCEFVNGKDDIPYMEHKIHVPNHQPVYKSL